MAFSQCYALFVALPVIFLLSNPTLTEGQTQDLIDKVCRQMEEYGFCNKTFNDNLKTPSADYVGLTEITIDQAIKNATDTHDFIVQLLQNTTEGKLKDDLIECEAAYSLVEKSFQDAHQSFDAKDYDGMLKSEQVTPRALGSCNVTFNTPPPVSVNPLVDRNRQMRILNAMAIVTGHELVVSNRVSEIH